MTMSVRRVTSSDIPRIAELEIERWGRIPGVPPLTTHILYEWFNEQSPFFLVAVYTNTDGSEAIHGYYFGRLIPQEDTDTLITKFVESEHLRNSGYTEQVHDPHGSIFYGINVTSIHPNAGIALQDAIISLLKIYRINKMIGVARLSGFRYYLSKLSTNLTDPATAAYQYTYRQLRKMNGFISNPDELLTDDYPEPIHHDRVLYYHVHTHRSHKLLTCLPYLPNDTKSAGWGALLIADIAQ